LPGGIESGDPLDVVADLQVDCRTPTGGGDTVARVGGDRHIEGDCLVEFAFEEMRPSRLEGNVSWGSFGSRRAGDHHRDDNERA